MGDAVFNSGNSQKSPGSLYLLWFLQGPLSFFFKFIYSFFSALGLRCCTWAFSSCCERGLLLAVVHGLLIAVASPVAEHGL